MESQSRREGSFGFPQDAYRLLDGFPFLHTSQYSRTQQEFWQQDPYLSWENTVCVCVCLTPELLGLGMWSRLSCEGNPCHTHCSSSSKRGSLFRIQHPSQLSGTSQMHKRGEGFPPPPSNTLMKRCLLFPAGLPYSFYKICTIFWPSCSSSLSYWKSCRTWRLCKKSQFGDFAGRNPEVDRGIRQRAYKSTSLSHYFSAGETRCKS